MKKKCILILALLLLFSVFAGCYSPTLDWGTDSKINLTGADVSYEDAAAAVGIYGDYLEIWIKGKADDYLNILNFDLLAKAP